MKAHQFGGLFGGMVIIGALAGCSSGVGEPARDDGDAPADTTAGDPMADDTGTTDDDTIMPDDTMMNDDMMMDDDMDMNADMPMDDDMMMDDEMMMDDGMDMNDDMMDDTMVTDEMDTMDDMAMDDMDGAMTEAAEMEVPDNAYCMAVSDWKDNDRAFESEVVQLINQRRAAGADCGSQGSFEPAGPLEDVGEFRCAARKHSVDMFERDFFSHTNPDGEDPGERLSKAGFYGSSWGENIAFGQTTPAQVVDAWMNSDGHCANIMRASYTKMGAGYHSSNTWTTVFGRD